MLMVLNLDANWGGMETRLRNATCNFSSLFRNASQKGLDKGFILHTNNAARANEAVFLSEPLALAGGDLLIISLGAAPPAPAPAESPPFALGADAALLGAGVLLCLLACFKSRRPAKRQPLDEYGVGNQPTSPKLLLAAFTLVNLMTYVDRGFLSGVLDKLKAAYVVGDTAAGILGGAYMLGYVVAAPIFTHYLPRFRPFSIMSFGMGIWVLATAASGLTQDYGSLLVARTLTGVGESSFLCVAPTVIDKTAPPQSRSVGRPSPLLPPAPAPVPVPCSAPPPRKATFLCHTTLPQPTDAQQG